MAVKDVPFWRSRAGRTLLALAGIYYMLMSLLDQTFYNWIAGLSPSDSVLVMAGLFASSVVPALFSLAALKHTLFPGARAITRYERIMRHPWFWYLGGTLGVAVGLWGASSETEISPAMFVPMFFGLVLAAYGFSRRQRQPIAGTKSWR